MDNAYVKATSDGANVSGSFSLPAGSSLADLLFWAGNQGEGGVDGPIDGPRPFLTVVTRTQGKRIEELSEVFTCLMAQTCDDFEVLLAEHDVESADARKVEELIASLPRSLRERVRVLPVSGGNRTRPLTEAFALARGRYISILDDDDLVFDHWVATFKEGAEAHPGKIVRAFAYVQHWLRSERADGSVFLRAVGTPEPVYCDDFNPYENLLRNSSPTLSLAFPAFAFQGLGLAFDETLTTVEDWDFFLKCYFVCGLHDTREATSIYRYWDNVSNSRTEHNMAEWRRNEDAIATKCNEVPLLFGSGSRDALVQAFGERDIPLTGGSRGVSCKAYFDIDPRDADDRQNVLGLFEGAEDGTYTLTLDEPQVVNDITVFLLRKSHFTCGYFDIDFEDADGNQISTSLNGLGGVTHNGYQVDSYHVLFLESEHWFRYVFPRPFSLKTITVRLGIEDIVRDVHVQQATRSPWSMWAGRVGRKIGRMARSTLRRR